MAIGRIVWVALGACVIVLALGSVNTTSAVAEDKMICKAVQKRFDEYIGQRRYHQALLHVDSMKRTGSCSSKHLTKLRKVAMTGYCKPEHLKTETFIAQGDLSNAERTVKLLKQKHCPTETLTRRIAKKATQLAETRRRQEAKERRERAKREAEASRLQAQRKAEASRLRAKEQQRLKKETLKLAKQDYLEKTRSPSTEDFSTLAGHLSECDAVLSKKEFARSDDATLCSRAFHDECLSSAGLPVETPEDELPLHGIDDPPPPKSLAQRNVMKNSSHAKRMTRIALWLVGQQSVGEVNPPLWIAAQSCAAEMLGKAEVSSLANKQSKSWHGKGQFEAIADCLDSCGLESADRSLLKLQEAGKGYGARIERNIRHLEQSVGALLDVWGVENSRIERTADSIRADLQKHGGQLASQQQVLRQKFEVQLANFTKKLSQAMGKELRARSKSMKKLSRKASGKRVKIDELQSTASEMGQSLSELRDLLDQYLGDSNGYQRDMDLVVHLQGLNEGVVRVLDGLQQQAEEKRRAREEEQAEDNEAIENTRYELCQITGMIRKIKMVQALNRKTDKRSGTMNLAERRQNEKALIYQEGLKKSAARTLKKLKSNFRFKRDCDEDEW